LSIAVRAGNLEIVQWIFSLFDRQTIETELFPIALASAALGNQTELMEWLISIGANIAYKITKPDFEEQFNKTPKTLTILQQRVALLK